MSIQKQQENDESTPPYAMRTYQKENRYIREHINKGRNESLQYRGVFISQQYSRRGNKIDLTDRIHHFQQYD